MFRILYINTSDKVGGAAIACDRLRVSLERIGEVESLSIVHQKTSMDANVLQAQSLLRKNRRLVEGWIKQHISLTGYQYRFMPFTEGAVLRRARMFRPHIINVHNMHAGMEGFVPVGLIKELSRIAPIVWTFHDMWPLTGHCAYAMECDRWRTGCGRCPRLREYPAIQFDRSRQNWAYKKAVFGASDITVVTPSYWLAEECRESPLFAGKRVETINNGINLNLYQPGDKREARVTLGLDSDSLVMMFVAQKATENRRKGTGELVTIVEQLSQKINREVVLLTLGKGDLVQSGKGDVKIVSLGYVADERRIATAYQAADLFLFPTRADNLPNSLIEAICCGTPCATFALGGCGEIIQDDYNGILVPPFDTDEMVTRLIRFFNSPEERARLSLAAYGSGHERYDWNEMARKYLVLMRELVIARRNSA